MRAEKMGGGTGIKQDTETERRGDAKAGGNGFHSRVSGSPRLSLPRPSSRAPRPSLS